MDKLDIQDLPVNTIFRTRTFALGEATILKAHYGYLNVNDPLKRIWPEQVEKKHLEYTIISNPVPPERFINIAIRETVVYGRSFPVKELEEISGKLLADDFGGNVQEFVDYIRENDITHGDFAELVEKDGEVDGQVWTATLTEVHPE